MLWTKALSLLLWHKESPDNAKSDKSEVVWWRMGHVYKKINWGCSWIPGMIQTSSQAFVARHFQTCRDLPEHSKWSCFFAVLRDTRRTELPSVYRTLRNAVLGNALGPLQTTYKSIKPLWFQNCDLRIVNAVLGRSYWRKRIHIVDKVPLWKVIRNLVLVVVSLGSTYQVCKPSNGYRAKNCRRGQLDTQSHLVSSVQQ